jgi:Ca2+-binding EF-hand superfamily protein
LGKEMFSMFNKMNRTGLGIALVGLTLAASSVAFAKGGEGRCSGEHTSMTPEQKAQRSAERFQKADKNSDGFIAKDEVSEKRWERIKVADANNDGKISKAELDQARTEGKLGHGHKPA